jgi:hypothetical protein
MSVTLDTIVVEEEELPTNGDKDYLESLPLENLINYNKRRSAGGAAASSKGGRMMSIKEGATTNYDTQTHFASSQKGGVEGMGAYSSSHGRHDLSALNNSGYDDYHSSKGGNLKYNNTPIGFHQHDRAPTAIEFNQKNKGNKSEYNMLSNIAHQRNITSQAYT